MAVNSAPLLPFHELFTESNLFYSPPEEEYDPEYIESEATSAETGASNDENGNKKCATATALFPHVEPAISVNARHAAKCFNFDALGASLEVGSPPFEWNPDWKKLRDFLQMEGRLSIEAALELVKRTRNLLQTEKNVLYLRPPYTRT